MKIRQLEINLSVISLETNLITIYRSRDKSRFRQVNNLARPSGIEGIGPFHGEAGLANLRRIGRGYARKLRSHVVNDIKIAVWAVVVAQTKVGANGLCVGCVHLNETRKCQKAVKGVIPLQASQHNRETAIGQWQSKTVPRPGSVNREFCTGAIVALYGKFVQPSSIEAAESLDQIVSESAILARAIGELMASEVIKAVRDKNILIDMKQRRNALGEHVHDVVVSITTIIQLGIKTRQPLLSEYSTVSVGSVKQKPFELQLTNADDLGPGLER